jgi:hypothetical protein
MPLLLYKTLLDGVEAIDMPDEIVLTGWRAHSGPPQPPR